MSVKCKHRGIEQGRKIYSKRILVFSAIIFSIILSGCSKYDEPVPFFDGLTLRYKTKYTITFNTGEYMRIYQLTALNGGYKVLGHTDFNEEDIDEMIVDSYGKIKDETSIGSFLYSLVFDSNDFKNRMKDKYSLLWMPTNKMKIGDKFNDGTIIRKEHWREWDVLVLRDSNFSTEFYFDVDTGYLVGNKLNFMKMKSEQVLINTNAEIAVEDGF